MKLTERELEVLSYICKGYNGPEIAEALFVTRSTVKAHTLSILRKLGVKTQAHAVRIATIENIV